MNALFSSALCLLLSSSAAAPAWTPKAARGGIEVYTASIAGSEYVAFKAVTVLDASPAEVLRVVEDPSGYADWFAYTETARVLDEKGAEKLLYMETQFPWPFSNEDMVYRLRRTADGQTTRIDLEGVPGQLPVRNGIYRMKSARGHIEVKPVGARTEVTYVMHTELGGRIPLWMANENIHEMPLRTLGALRARVVAQ